jgi:hypothetical protein
MRTQFAAQKKNKMGRLFSVPRYQPPTEGQRDANIPHPELPWLDGRHAVHKSIKHFWIAQRNMTSEW